HTPPAPPSFPTRRSSDLPAQVQTALENLTTIGVGNVKVLGNTPTSAAGGTYTVIFQNALANANLPQLSGIGTLVTGGNGLSGTKDRKSTRLNSSHDQISY